MPSPSPYFSKAELARHFQLPESTIRFYCTRFADFLPAKGEGRAIRYAPECLDVLTCIKENLPQARTSAVMEETLTQHFPRHGRKSQTWPRATRPSKNAPTDTIPDRFSQCLLPEQERAFAEQMASVHATLAALQSETDALRAEVQHLRILLDTSEKTHQSDLDQLRTWMGRMAQASQNKS